MRLFLRWSAWLCLLLTLWSAAALVLHHHQDGTESAKCTVCVAALSTSPSAPVLLPQSTRIVVSAATPEAPPSAPQRLAIFALTVRPPPQF